MVPRSVIEMITILPPSASSIRGATERATLLVLLVGRGAVGVRRCPGPNSGFDSGTGSGSGSGPAGVGAGASIRAHASGAVADSGSGHPGAGRSRLRRILSRLARELADVFGQAH